jgi:hypothetical protein
MARPWSQNGTGWDTDEGVQKVAGLVWDTDTLQWVRATPASGTAGTSETSPKQSLFDQADATTLYIGTSAPGVLTTDNLWRIKRVTFDPMTGNPLSIKYANSGAANNQWAQRQTLAYS